MFGSKKSRTETLAAALLRGITDAGIETDDAPTCQKGSLQKAYNNASGIIKGLTALRDMTGSKVKFEVSENGKHVEIYTNIFNTTAGPGSAHAVRVGPNGRITLGRASKTGGFETGDIKSKGPCTTEKAIMKLARAAVVTGLIS